MSIFDKANEVTVKPHGYQYKDYEGMVISPSGLRNFYDNPKTWYRNVVLKERTFFGNANTVFGTLVHAYAEEWYSDRVTNTQKLHQNHIDALLRNEDESLRKTIDFSYFELVCQVLRSEYLEVYPHPEEVEGYVEYDYSDDIKIAGSFDALEKNPDGTYTVVDFKTANSSKGSMNEYVLQLSIYARLLKLTRGIDVTKLRVVLIVKTKEPKILVLETEPNILLANKTLSLATQSIELSKTNPSIVDLLFKENYFSFSTDEKMCEDTTVITSEQRIKSKLKKDIFG